MKKVAILLFDDFETLDVFGPVEIFGRLKEHYTVLFYSLHGGLVANNHGVSVMTDMLANRPKDIEIFLIPGGYGTRVEVNNPALIETIRTVSESSPFVLTVCTGTALLARTGLLDGKNATSNKRAFDWVMNQGQQVHWRRKARWVVDGKYYTSAGVTAGMDMTLGFLQDRHGTPFARKTAFEIEYNWQENKEEDPFSEG
jgi:putative intracellular protease/amidase